MSAAEDVDRRFVELLKERGGLPSVMDSLAWNAERLANCLRYAALNTGPERDGWLADAAYYAKTLAIIRTIAAS